MKRADRLAMHYIRAADLRAIYIAARGRDVRIGITRDPKARGRELTRRGEKLAAVTWCNSSDDARRVIAGVAEAIPGIEVSARAGVEKAKAKIVEVAKAERIGLGADETVRKRAAEIVADIDARVKAMQSSGHLRDLNQRYREARAEASRNRVAFHSYGDHLERYKIRMLYEIANGVK